MKIPWVFLSAVFVFIERIWTDLDFNSCDNFTLGVMLNDSVIAPHHHSSGWGHYNVFYIQPVFIQSLPDHLTKWDDLWPVYLSSSLAVYVLTMGLRILAAIRTRSWIGWLLTDQKTVQQRYVPYDTDEDCHSKPQGQEHVLQTCHTSVLS